MKRIAVALTAVFLLGSASVAEATRPERQKKRIKKPSKRGRSAKAALLPDLVAPPPIVAAEAGSALANPKSADRTAVKPGVDAETDSKVRPFRRVEARSSAPWSPYVWTLLALSLAGAGAVMLKKRRGRGDGGDSIDVLATRTVSPKVRIIVLRNRDREFLVSVADQGATLLSEWVAGEEETPVPSFSLEAPVKPRRSAEQLEATKPIPPATTVAPAAFVEPAGVSPALSGLYDLRRESRDQA